MATKWCTKLEVAWKEEVLCFCSGSSIKFQGRTGWKIDGLNPIWVRLLGRSQLSNPSDLPCFFFQKWILGSSIIMVFHLHHIYVAVWFLNFLPMVYNFVVLYITWLTHWGRDKWTPFHRRHFLNSIFLKENVWTPIKFSLKFVPKGRINNIATLVQIKAWHRVGHTLSEPIMVNSLTHIFVTRPQLVKKNTHGVLNSSRVLRSICHALFVLFY